MSEQKRFTINDIREWGACYDPSSYLPEEWEGTALDILRHPYIPPQDKLWVVCREPLIDERTLRLFAVWCARQVEYLMVDERSKKALVVAEAYARGEASDTELAAARRGAFTAASAAASAAADVVAAADAATCAASADADAAGDAAAKAAKAAGVAAGDAARAAAGYTQINKLIEMVDE